MRSERSERGAGMTVHEASRAKKAVQMSMTAIQNRIRFFQREEEKIWRDLEEVRRQAATIEEGRHRSTEKRLADQTIQKERELMLEQNRAKAAALRSVGSEARKHHQFQQMREKQIAAQESRKASQDILKKKRMQEAQMRLQNSERAVAIQRAQIEARLRTNQERAAKLEKLREEQELDRQHAEMEVQGVEGLLPALEEQEMICLQRLQNSRIVTQSVLEELETSLGSRSSVTTLLRSKQRGQEHLQRMSASTGLLFSVLQETARRDEENIHPSEERPGSSEQAADCDLPMGVR